MSANGDGADGAPGDALPPGTELGRYTVITLVGTGGMGAVYEGVHRDLKKRVAIKTLHRRLAGSDEVRARFVREGQAASRIRHEHVVDVTDVGVEGDVPYLVMEYLEGENLASLIAREGPLSATRVADLLVPVASALAAAHASGIVHRDLKPENVFLSGPTASPKPKVLDFGISKIVESGTAHGHQLTGTSAMLGTPFYMSPEQAQDAKNIDARTDQYSFGVILYEAVTGRRPFGDQALYSLLNKIVEGRFEPPRTLVAELPRPFDALILRAMAKLPVDRFESISALGMSLLEFAGERTRLLYAESLRSARASAQPAPASGVGARTPNQLSYGSATSTLGGSKPQRSGALWIWAAGALAVAVGAVMALSGGGSSAAVPPAPEAPSVAAAAPKPAPAPGPTEEAAPAPPASALPVPVVSVAAPEPTPSASAAALPAKAPRPLSRPRASAPKLAPR